MPSVATNSATVNQPRCGVEASRAQTISGPHQRPRRPRSRRSVAPTALWNNIFGTPTESWARPDYD